jgi:hypothetical protein
MYFITSLSSTNFLLTLLHGRYLFLEKRLQYVRIGGHVSDVRELNAGALQGTIAGPNDFKVLINELHFELLYTKYVDDTTVASVS